MRWFRSLTGSQRIAAFSSHQEMPETALRLQRAFLWNQTFSSPMTDIISPIHCGKRGGEHHFHSLKMSLSAIIRTNVNGLWMAVWKPSASPETPEISSQVSSWKKLLRNKSQIFWSGVQFGRGEARICCAMWTSSSFLHINDNLWHNVSTCVELNLYPQFFVLLGGGDVITENLNVETISSCSGSCVNSYQMQLCLSKWVSNNN